MGISTGRQVSRGQRILVTGIFTKSAMMSMHKHLNPILDESFLHSVGGKSSEFLLYLAIIIDFKL